MNPSMPVQLFGLQPIDQDAGNDVSHDPQVEDVRAVEEQSGPIFRQQCHRRRIVARRRCRLSRRMRVQGSVEPSRDRI